MGAAAKEEPPLGQAEMQVNRAFYVRMRCQVPLRDNEYAPPTPPFPDARSGTPASLAHADAELQRPVRCAMEEAARAGVRFDEVGHILVGKRVSSSHLSLDDISSHPNGSKMNEALGSSSLLDSFPIWSRFSVKSRH